jgi:hypothetical protein
MNLNEALGYSNPVQSTMDRTFDINPITMQHQKMASQYPQAPSRPRSQLPNYVPQLVNAPVSNQNDNFNQGGWSEPQGFGLGSQNQMGSVVDFGVGSRSNQADFTPMSQTFLQMKQNQEKEILLNNGDVNPVSLERLKQDQAQELQKNLQSQNYLGSSLLGFDFTQGNDYAKISGLPTVGLTTAYNAQGEAVGNASTLHQDQPNKYLMMKQMSPETLNQMYGRPAGQSVQPEPVEMGSGDIYDQTSWSSQNLQVKPGARDQLKTQLESRKNEILGQKSKTGIQSFNQDGFGTNLNDAYRNIAIQLPNSMRS